MAHIIFHILIDDNIIQCCQQHSVDQTTFHRIRKYVLDLAASMLVGLMRAHELIFVQVLLIVVIIPANKTFPLRMEFSFSPEPKREDYFSPGPKQGHYSCYNLAVASN